MLTSTPPHYGSLGWDSSGSEKNKKHSKSWNGLVFGGWLGGGGLDIGCGGCNVQPLVKSEIVSCLYPVGD